jgi:hypothetical protein
VLDAVVSKTGSGAAVVNVNAAGSVTDCPSGLVTVTSTVPAAWAGVRTESSVALTTVTIGASLVPKRTVAPETKFSPMIVIVSPPDLVPLEAPKALSPGAGAAAPPPPPQAASSVAMKSSPVQRMGQGPPGACGQEYRRKGCVVFLKKTLEGRVATGC